MATKLQNLAGQRLARPPEAQTKAGRVHARLVRNTCHRALLRQVQHAVVELQEQEVCQRQLPAGWDEQYQQ